MTQTITDTGGTYLVLRVAAAPDVSEGGIDYARWHAHVCDPANPLAGIAALGGSLTEARDAVAVTAWAAVMAGELASLGHTADTLAGIHLELTTTTTYDAGWLTAKVANHAA